MPVKMFQTASFGQVKVTKRRGSKSIRLSINADGQVRLTQPTWLPYSASITFLNQKQHWVEQQRAARITTIEPGQNIGKRHTITFSAEPHIQSCRADFRENTIAIRYPLHLSHDSGEVQAAAQRAAKKALKQQASDYLPKRLVELSERTQLSFTSVATRHLKTRWGSCSTHKHITLNYYLMLLPYSLIDYVLIHELAHTRHMNHSPEFWSEVENHLPDYKLHRKKLKNYQPSVFSLQA